MGGTTDIRILRTGSVLAALALTMLVMSMLLFISVAENKFLLAASPILASTVVVLVVAFISIFSVYRAGRSHGKFQNTALTSQNEEPHISDAELNRLVNARRLASYGVGIAIIVALVFAVLCSVTEIVTEGIVYSLLIAAEGPVGLGLASAYLTRTYKNILRNAS